MEESKRALLVVAGGRPIPDILSLFYVQPHIVVYLKSNEGWRDEEGFVSAATSMGIVEQVKCIPKVDAFHPQAAKIACESALQEFPNVEWTFTMSAGPKITSISAYEFARQRNIPCLFVDTQHKRLILLEKDIVKEIPNLVQPNVEQYMSYYNRTFKLDDQQYRATAEKWTSIAQDMALSPDTDALLANLREALREENKKRPKGEIINTLAISPTTATLPLTQALETTYQLIQLTPENNGMVNCTFTSPYARRFIITGDWLEIYTWSAAKNAGVLEDIQWGYKTIGGKAENELDLVATYYAQLIVGECKSGPASYVFDRKHLDTLDSVGNILGGRYVTKLLITDQNNYSHGFKEQAEKKHIYIITKKDLPRLNEIIYKQTTDPDYPRI